MTVTKLHSAVDEQVDLVVLHKLLKTTVESWKFGGDFSRTRVELKVGVAITSARYILQ